jgi:dolichol-phosphate mannosyltransferase
MPIFEGLDPRAIILRHPENRGKGAAIKTALAHIQTLTEDYDPENPPLVGVMDADGQHLTSDMARVFEGAAAHPDKLTLGVRVVGKEMPLRSRFGNSVTRTFFHLLTGAKVSDTQTGLRGFASGLLPTMIAVKGERYEYEMNMLIECARQRLPMRALPIETVYENNNEGSHFRAVRDSVRIYSVILAGFFRFISASLISFLIDYGLYLLFNNVLRAIAPALSQQFTLLMLQFIPRIAIATILARIISGVCNYTMNRKLVFKDTSSAKKSFPRYLAVFLMNIVLSAALVSSLHLWFGWSDNLIKIPVDILLFFLSYTLQQRWVFKG